MKIKITTEETTAKDLTPGNLFTTAPQEYWDFVEGADLDAIGQTIYFRTEAPCPKSQAKVRVYKVKIEKFAETLQEMGLDLFERSDPRA